MLRLVLAAGAVLTMGTASFAESPAAQRGFVFAKTNCAKCHAIGQYGDSPLAIAPPFRTLHQRYAIEELEEAFAEGIVTGHPTMPQFQLDPAEVNNLIAYLKTLK